MVEPSNILMGDVSDFDMSQPIEGVVEEKQLAQYATSEEFKQIQEYCADRIAFYQRFLPNGAEVGFDAIPTTEDWRVANRVICEFNLLMNRYETAIEAVTNE